MIADSQIYKSVGKGINLLGNKVLPFNPLIVRDRQVFVAIFRSSKQILIKIVVCPKIAQVPVEFCTIGPHAGGDTWHHDVPTISGVTRNRKGPCVRRLCRQPSEMNEKCTEKHTNCTLRGSRFQDYSVPFSAPKRAKSRITV